MFNVQFTSRVTAVGANELLHVTDSMFTYYLLCKRGDTVTYHLVFLVKSC